MGIREQIEKQFGLPPLEKIEKLTSGETGDKLNKLLARFQRLSKNTSNLPQIIELLNLIIKMDERGVFEKLAPFVRDLVTLTQSKTAKDLLEKIDKLSAIADNILKGED